MESKLEHTIDMFVAEMESISRALEKLQKTSDDLNNKFDTLQISHEEFKKETNTKFGVLFEMGARQTLIPRYGANFVQQFEVKSLLGLARISFPKKEHTFSLPGADNYKSKDETQVQQLYARKLNDFVFKERLYIKALENCFNCLLALGKDNPKILGILQKTEKGCESLQRETPLGNKDDKKQDDTIQKALHDGARDLEAEIGSLPEKKKTFKSCIEGLKVLSTFFGTQSDQRSNYLYSNSRAGILM